MNSTKNTNTNNNDTKRTLSKHQQNQTDVLKDLNHDATIEEILTASTTNNVNHSTRSTHVIKQ